MKRLVLVLVLIYLMLPLIAFAGMNVSTGSWSSPQGVTFNVDAFGNVSNVWIDRIATAYCSNSAGETSAGENLPVQFYADNTAITMSSNGFSVNGQKQFTEHVTGYRVTMNYVVSNVSASTNSITGTLTLEGNWYLQYWTMVTSCQGTPRYQSINFTATPAIPSPTGSVSVAGHQVVNNETIATFTLIATAYSGSTISSMRFSNDGTTWSAWEPYSTTKTWNMGPVTSSINTAYVQFNDSVGRLSKSYPAVVTEMGELDTSFSAPYGEKIFGGSGMDYGGDV
jgi:hypothetical protein